MVYAKRNIHFNDSKCRRKSEQKEYTPLNYHKIHLLQLKVETVLIVGLLAIPVK